MELVDRQCRVSVMEAHIDACEGSLVDDMIVKSPLPVSGKAIVFARTDVVTPDTTTWLGDFEFDVRDVPRPHQRIARGQPVCTVFATGGTEDACHDALVRRAADIYALLEEAAPA
jgi:predicted ATP-grasp superfamily ATP-dependent carboligase